VCVCVCVCVCVWCCILNWRRLSSCMHAAMPSHLTAGTRGQQIDESGEDIGACSGVWGLESRVVLPLSNLPGGFGVWVPLQVCARGGGLGTWRRRRRGSSRRVATAGARGKEVCIKSHGPDKKPDTREVKQARRPGGGYGYRHATPTAPRLYTRLQLIQIFKRQGRRVLIDVTLRVHPSNRSARHTHHICLRRPRNTHTHARTRHHSRAHAHAHTLVGRKCGAKGFSRGRSSGVRSDRGGCRLAGWA
jgi:hypothetical protein